MRNLMTAERGIQLVQRVIAHLKKRADVATVGASPQALDALESKLMVELPPTLRLFLQYDFTFASFGPRFKGKHRFGTNPQSPKPKLTSVRKLAEAIVELGWTESKARAKVVRLPNRSRDAWNALYLGDARRDGELPILGLAVDDDTLVRVFPRYSGFDLYLAEQTGFVKLTEAQRLDDIESHIAANPELGTPEEDDESEVDY